MYKIYFGLSKEEMSLQELERDSGIVYTDLISKLSDIEKGSISFYEDSNQGIHILWSPGWKKLIPFIYRFAKNNGLIHSYLVVKIHDSKIKGTLNTDSLREFINKFFDDLFTINVYKEEGYNVIELRWKDNDKYELEIAHTLVSVLADLLLEPTFVTFFNDTNNHEFAEIGKFLVNYFKDFPLHAGFYVEHLLVANREDTQYQASNYRLNLGVNICVLLALLDDPILCSNLFDADCGNILTSLTFVDQELFDSIIEYLIYVMKEERGKFYICAVRTNFYFKIELLVKILRKEKEDLGQVLNIGELKYLIADPD